MDWEIAEANWKQFKGTVRARWGKLTDEHLEAIGGKRDQLLMKIQELYDISRPDAQRDLKSFEERNKDYKPKKAS
ncbi:MAG TPA: CsbD family protein [Steroidobacteraceae bacterium]|nr:CsbD family protein [Steroidobacteraceae bacterium]